MFVTACGITSYDTVSPSDHRGEFLNIRLQQFLANSFQEVTDHTSRKLQTRDSAGVITYKEHLRDFTNTHHIFDRINNLKHKLTKEQLKIDDMKEINDLDYLITKGMIASENKTLKRQNQYPWSLTLEQAILEVSLWKLIKSEIKNEVSKEMQIQRIIVQLDAPPLLERKSIKVVINYLRKSKKSLMQIQREVKHYREKIFNKKQMNKKSEVTWNMHDI